MAGVGLELNLNRGFLEVKVGIYGYHINNQFVVMTAAPAAEQLNLKVKSQVFMHLFRMEKKCSSKSKIPHNSKSSWMPTANDNLYQFCNSAQGQQRQIPL